MIKNILFDIKFDMCKPFNIKIGKFKVEGPHTERTLTVSNKEIYDSELGSINKEMKHSLIYLYFKRTIKVTSI